MQGSLLSEQVSLLMSKEPETVTGESVMSTQGFPPCASVPTAAGALSTAGYLGQHWISLCSCTATSPAQPEASETCRDTAKAVKAWRFYLKWEKVGAFSWGRERGTSQRAAATLGSV